MSIWTTREGVEMEVSKMDDNHLLNTIRFLERRHNAKRTNIDAYFVGPLAMPQGEMAQDAFWQEFDHAVDTLGPFDAIYTDMLDEAEARGLQVTGQ